MNVAKIATTNSTFPRRFQGKLTVGLALAALGPTGIHAASKAAGTPPSPTALVLGRLETREDATSAQELRGVLEAYGQLLEFLPLNRLDRACWGRGALELEFDFGGRSSLEVELPAFPKVALIPSDPSDPMAGGKLVRSRGKARRLVVKERLRFTVDGGAIEGVRRGDLKIAWGVFSFDVHLETEARPDSWARDEHGRILLKTDESGDPVDVGGRYCPIEADRWLVLEVRGTRQEIALRPPSIDTFAPTLRRAVLQGIALMGGLNFRNLRVPGHGRSLDSGCVPSSKLTMAGG